MGEIDPRLSAPLCLAIAEALTRDLATSLTCVDVSRVQPALSWDLEAKDRWGVIVLRISHTRSVWKESLEGLAEAGTVQEGLEAALESYELRNLVVDVHAHQLPSSKPKRRKFGASLAPYVLSSARMLNGASTGTRVDVLRTLEESSDPRAMELVSALNVFEVQKIATGSGPIVMIGDERTFRWLPDATEGVLDRLEGKSEDQHKVAHELVLLVEVEDATLNAPIVAQLKRRVATLPRTFQALYVCTRDHGFDYRVFKVY